MDGLFPRLSDRDGVRIRDDEILPRLNELAERGGGSPLFKMRTDNRIDLGDAGTVKMSMSEEVRQEAIRQYRKLQQEAIEDRTLAEQWDELAPAAQGYARAFAVPSRLTGTDFENWPRDVQETAVAIGRGYQNKVARGIS